MARQVYIDEDVLTAARARVAWIFDHFAQIHVSISGGKDSEVVAHLALVEAHRRGRRIGLFVLDEEVMYQSSVEICEYLMGLYPENTIRIWVQIPFTLTNAVSLTEAQLNAWEPGKHKEWMRPKGPAEKGYIAGKPWPPERERLSPGLARLDFYGAVNNFQACYEGVALLVGLRAAGESPNRWRAVTKNPVEVDGERVYWGTRKGKNTALYPIYDWNHSDVWRYLNDQGLKYSRIYDHQFRKGFSLTEMRTSSLIHERSFKSLCELPEFEPKTYARLCKRVKGIAFAQETGKSAKMFAARKLPKNYASWGAYRDFLLATYPHEERRGIFERRFARQRQNEYVARQQVRQLLLNDYENSLAIDDAPDPREAMIAYYREVL